MPKTGMLADTQHLGLHPHGPNCHITAALCNDDQQSQWENGDFDLL